MCDALVARCRALPEFADNAPTRALLADVRAYTTLIARWVLAHPVAHDGDYDRWAARMTRLLNIARLKPRISRDHVIMQLLQRPMVLYEGEEVDDACPEP